MGKAVPETGGMKLLWENPSPSATFSAQTVNVAEAINAVLVLFSLANTGSTETLKTTCAGFNGTTTQAIARFGMNALGDRTFEVKSGVGVIFSNATNNQSAVNNNWMIPYRIYKIS